MPAHGIMFHHFRDEGLPNFQGALTASLLTKMIEFLGPGRILPARE